MENPINDTLAAEEVDGSEHPNIFQKTTEDEKYYNESDVLPSDSLFDHLELELTEITAKQFHTYANDYKTDCRIDSSGFIIGYGITVSTECHDICITDLIDNTDEKILQLPCNYDQGILGLSFSPSCDQFVTYSCYDSPDFDRYYEYRSEIVGFNIANGSGLKTIKPSFKYYTKDLSIDSLTWAGDRTIALRVYMEGIPSAGNSFSHKYFKTNLPK